MTRKNILSVLLLSLFLCPGNAANARKHKKQPVIQNSEPIKHTNGNIKVKGILPMMPVSTTNPQPAEEKNSEEHGSKNEELPHIHHFHKHRVKKLNRHHHEVWLGSKALVILCHLLLLVMCYLHASG